MPRRLAPRIGTVSPSTSSSSGPRILTTAAIDNLPVTANATGYQDGDGRGSVDRPSTRHAHPSADQSIEPRGVP